MTPLRGGARFEHRLTRPTASLADLDAAVALVVDSGLDALMVSPWLVKPASRLLSRSGVRLGTVIGFPHGGQVAAVKAFEASNALEHGAVELDFVLNGGALVSRDDEAVLRDMLAVVEMAHSGVALAGVIVDSAALDEELVRRACRLAARAGVDYAVTSSGEEPAAITIQRTAFLHRVLGGQLEVKAAGIFTEAAQLDEVVAAGATRVSVPFSVHLAQAAELAAGRDPAVPPVGAAAG